MERNNRPVTSYTNARSPSHHGATYTIDTATNSRDTRSTASLHRRPSLSAVAALFSTSRNQQNSWRTSTRSPYGTTSTTMHSPIYSPTDDSSSRSRRPSLSLAELSRGLFGHRSRDANIDETMLDVPEPPSTSKGSWLKKLKSPFKRDRTSSMGEMDDVLSSDPFYSLSTSVPAHIDNKAKQWHYYGGAAARAAAAAQNEASSSSLVGFRRDLSRLQEPQNDSESGIGIDLDDHEDEVETESVMVRIDPASILPEEIFAHCLSYLDSISLTDAELVSRRWHETANSRSMWRTLFGMEFGKASNISSPLPQSGGQGYGKQTGGQEWKKMWKARKALQQRWTDGHAAAIYLEGHTDTVYCVQFDEKKVITGSRDRTLRIWDIETLQCVKIIGTPKDIRNSHATAPLTPPTRGCMPFKTIYSSPSESALKPVQHDPAMTHQGSILCLQFDANILVTGSSDTTVIVWSIQDDYKPIKRLRHHDAGVLDVCFDNNYIVSCSKDTTICLWNRHTGEQIHQLVGHRGPVNAVQLRGELIVSASGDGVAKLWNITSGLCVKEFSSKDRGLACVEFSPDCRYIYAGGNDQSIYQFDATTRELVREFKGHRNLVRSLHLDQANNRIVSGSYDHSIQVYDTQTGKMICEFAGWTTSWMLSAKVDYRRIVATSQDRRVVVVDFGLGVKDIDLLSGV